MYVLTCIHVHVCVYSYICHVILYEYCVLKKLKFNSCTCTLYAHSVYSANYYHNKICTMYTYILHTCTYVPTMHCILSTILQVHKRTSCTYEHAQLHVSTCTCMYMHVSMNIPHKYHTHS